MWWECIPPFAIIAGAMWAAGQGIGLVQRYQNGGKVSLDVYILTSPSKSY